MRAGNSVTAESPIISSNVIHMPVSESLIDLEFSDFGRDPRFPSGWWLAPLLVLLPAAIFVAGAFFIHFMRG